MWSDETPIRSPLTFKRAQAMAERSLLAKVFVCFDLPVWTQLQRAAIVGIFFSLLCALPATAQQYYTPNTGGLNNGETYDSSEIGPGIQKGQGTQNTICNGSSEVYVADSSPYLSGTTLLRPSLQLLQADGQWIPQSVMTTGPTDFECGQSTYISTISAAGMVTTSEQGSCVTPYDSDETESDTVLSTETLDLNTGKYTWHRVIYSSITESCPEQQDNNFG